MKGEDGVFVMTQMDFWNCLFREDTDYMETEVSGTKIDQVTHKSHLPPLFSNSRDGSLETLTLCADREIDSQIFILLFLYTPKNLSFPKFIPVND